MSSIEEDTKTTFTPKGIGYVLYVHAANPLLTDLFSILYNHRSIFMRNSRVLADFYGKYSSLFKDILKSVKEDKKKPKYLKFYENAVRQANGKTMKVYLAMPLWRMGRYQLLLAQLKKNIHPSSPEHASVSEAEELVKKIAMQIDQKCGRVRRQERPKSCLRR